MGFNYGLEKKKFDGEWERLRREYAAAGMDEAAIEAMHEFDWQIFKRERTYCRHTQQVPRQRFDEDGDMAEEGSFALYMKYADRFSVAAAEVDRERRDSWLDEIGSEALVARLKGLCGSDRELLTLYVFEGYTVTEIARMQGVSQPVISKKLNRLKKYLKNF
ncbi:MAG: sigma-70 family RNA polymerase sigma factor [Lachnospiraceae bacterium]|nr:sigma-70 family RNA polymerase sigma factor [Lachnospiraceae bacterium]